MNAKKKIINSNNKKSKNKIQRNFFTVIIPCVSHSYLLDKCLHYLNKQFFKNFEVIIISENNITISKKYFFDLTIIKNFFLLPGEKRNFAALSAKGEYLAFIDDDAYPDKNWLKNAFNFLISKKYNICLGGPGMLPKDSTFFEKSVSLFFISKIFHSDSERYFENKQMNNKIVYDWPSFNFFISRNFFLKIRGFDNRFWPGEDSKLCEKINKTKGVIYYLSNVKVFHHPRVSFFKFIKQIFRYGYHRGKFFKFGDSNSRNLKYTIPSIFLLFHFTFLINKFFFLLIMSFYIFLLIIDIFIIKIKKINIFHIVISRFLIYFAHIIYGIGFLRGIISKRYKASLYR